ncbi:zinc-dependent alcohol dehydrogenase [Pseudoduganella namucuonensis]|uniref:(R,R)-butanediol dehydrogenase / meso-butanediol dehydrogenase / diacetyl reductase n=1 Tax=Pseudoduganella namucuonensis TaxID=1035707 RepID=A0A1I7LSF9_9BURK|nr:zinc-binding dehydrogenase [Pseudoduganella namucuonensis]SFV12624.1 (R,R)-butanediol dehydrogenase / meso-butanediol dehydrogenase / diacetyl reductase [Pseudoduganella namucuonensis]
MKAAVFHAPGRIAPSDSVEQPRAGPGEVVVRVEACGICGSDMHMYRTGAHRELLVRRTGAGEEIPGHEFAGVVTAVGSEAGDYRVGERVVGVGMGGMAQYVPVPVNPFQLVRMPDGVSFDEAATTEPLADGLQMLRLAAIQPGENVVVFGVGIIGLGVLQALRALGIGAGHVIAIDVSASRLAMALAAGASHAVNPADGDALAAVAAICGTRSGYGSPDSPDVAVVIDCAGYLKHMKGPAPLQLALYMLRPSGGRVICFGAYEDKLDIDFMPVIQKQIAILGSNGYAAGELAQALELMASGKVDRRALISHRYPLEQVGQAFETQGGGQAIKVLLHPNAA